MKFRVVPLIAVALAWLGCGPSAPPAPTWELYLAPSSSGAIVGYDYSAPLSDWKRANDRAYSSRKECLAARADLISTWTGAARADSDASTSSYSVEIDRLRDGQCLASDDPRLSLQ
jgi:hypothetical protein